MPAPVLPFTFATPRSLAALNVIAVACSLAACTTATFMHVSGDWSWAAVAGLPTLAFGTLWAMLIRWRKTTRSGVRWGWLACVPLAALDAACACALLDSIQRTTPPNVASFLGAALIGATLGGLVWVPALLVVLAVFGAPLAHAQSLAKRGLTGEERGEKIVGALAATMATAAFVVAHEAHLDPARANDAFCTLVFHAFVLCAMGAGAIAFVRARVRERRRRAFVARVEANEVPGFRVDQTLLGKVLVHAPPVVDYRAPDETMDVFELDDAGNATHAVKRAQ